MNLKNPPLAVPIRHANTKLSLSGLAGTAHSLLAMRRAG